MSDGAVPPNKMTGPYDFDDASIEALLAGAGHDIDHGLADVLGDMRVAYTSLLPTVGADLATLIRPTLGRASLVSRGTRTRSVIAKIGAATAALIATTSGLAVAGALPAPVQNALSHIGIHAPSNGTSPGHHASITANTTTTTTTTVPDTTAPTTAADHHGTQVSGIAHQHPNNGCDHGHDVANVASNAKSNGQPCHNTSTTTAGTTPASPRHHNATRNNPSEPGHTSATTTAGSPNGGDYGGDRKDSGNHN